MRNIIFIIQMTNHQVEYSELCTNMRHYADMRFKQMTLFLAITSILLGLRFSGTFQIEPIEVIPLIGIFSVIIFIVLEERAADFYWQYRRRAKELERTLQFHQLLI